uniref:Uncharacterized protein n=1 Tax=Glossina palpalis gambiensis TaxID=67801 RepID=A0A1B0C6H9_9MUSC
MPRTIRKPHKSVSGDSNNNGCKRSMTIKVCNFEFVGVGALCLFVCLLLLLLLLCLPIKKHPQLILRAKGFQATSLRESRVLEKYIESSNKIY